MQLFHAFHSSAHLLYSTSCMANLLRVFREVNHAMGGGEGRKAVGKFGDDTANHVEFLAPTKSRSYQ